MKRLYFVILFTIFCGVANATDILNTFTDYRYAVKLGLGLDTNSATYADTTVNRQIRESISYCNPIVKFRLREFNVITTYKNNRYTLDTLVTGVEAVEWKKIDTVKSLVYAPKSTWYQLPVKRTADEPEAYARRPSYYDFTDTMLFLYPVPVETGDTIKVLAWTKIANQISADSLKNIPEEYRNLIKYHAIYELGKTRQHPMTQFFRIDFENAVAILNSRYGRQVAPVK